MAFEKIEITASEWTLVANNATTITFQNASQYPLYISFANSALANTETLGDAGLVYNAWEGELKKTVTDLTILAGAAYVYAKSASKDGTIIVEYE